MYTIKGSKTNLTTLFSVLTVLAGIRFVLSIVATVQDSYPLGIALTCIYGVLTLIFVLGIIKGSHCKVVFNNNDIVCTPFWGAPRTLTYHDLEKISMGGKNYVVYTKDGKKLCTFDDFHTEKASTIVAFLKEKGVRTEI